eukprot:543973-Pyramimonas_sp.AAC.1
MDGSVIPRTSCPSCSSPMPHSPTALLPPSPRLASSRRLLDRKHSSPSMPCARNRRSFLTHPQSPRSSLLTLHYDLSDFHCYPSGRPWRRLPAPAKRRPTAQVA